MASDDRFYLLEFRNRPVKYGDIGSLLKISGLVVTGGGAAAILALPGHGDAVRNGSKVFELSLEEWSDFIWRSDNPEILVGLAKTFQRKARYDISGAVQQRIWAADGFECQYCGVEMGKQLLTIDHFIPLEEGGENNARNYLTACKPCNKDKGSQHPREWKDQATYERLSSYLTARVI